MLVLNGENIKGLINSSSKEEQKSSPYVNVWLDDNKANKLRTENRWLTSEPQWNNNLTWNGVPSPNSIHIAVKHFASGKHSKPLGQVSYSFEAPLSCTVLLLKLVILDENQDCGAMSVKVLWLPTQDMSLFNNLWDSMLVLVSSVKGGDRSAINHLVTNLAAVNCTETVLYGKLLVIQRAFKFLDQYVIPALSEPSNPDTIKQALAAFDENRQDIQSWNEKYFIPSAEMKSSLPSEATNWSSAQRLLRESVGLSPEDNTEAEAEPVQKTKEEEQADALTALTADMTSDQAEAFRIELAGLDPEELAARIKALQVAQNKLKKLEAKKKKLEAQASGSGVNALKAKNLLAQMESANATEALNQAMIANASGGARRKSTTRRSVSERKGEEKVSKRTLKKRASVATPVQASEPEKEKEEEAPNATANATTDDTTTITDPARERRERRRASRVSAKPEASAGTSTGATGGDEKTKPSRSTLPRKSKSSPAGTPGGSEKKRKSPSGTPRGSVSESGGKVYKYVIARGARETEKKNQLSFGKGDIIKVIKDEGKWHVGVLVKSSTCELTGAKQFYPPNFVKPISKEKVDQLLA